MSEHTPGPWSAILLIVAIIAFPVSARAGCEIDDAGVIVWCPGAVHVYDPNKGMQEDNIVHDDFWRRWKELEKQVKKQKSWENAP